jgi:membrane protease YdiL (CAAX protease family)
MDEPAKSKVPASFWICLLAFYAVWFARAWLATQLDDHMTVRWQQNLLSNVFKFTLWVAPALVYVRFVAKEDPLAFCKITTRPAWSGSFRAVLIAVGFLIITAVEALWRGAKPLADWPVAFALVAVSPVSEEIAFRGFVQTTLRKAHGPLAANALTTVLFVAAHWPYWLLSGQAADKVVPSLGIAIFSLVAGHLAERTSSIWPSVALHIANNFLFAIAADQR